MEGIAGEQHTSTPDQIMQAFQASTAELKRTLQSTCTSLRNEILHQQSESREALTQKIKECSNKRWKKEGNRKQFEFNAEVIDSLHKATEAIKVGDTSSCSTRLEQAMKQLIARQKLIRMADVSESGWQTVREYETNELASDSEDEKRINRAEARAANKFKRSRSSSRYRGSSRFRPYTSNFRIPGSTTTPATISNQRVYRPRPDTKSGSCFACAATGHWRRECPFTQPGRNYAPATVGITSARDIRT